MRGDPETEDVTRRAAASETELVAVTSHEMRGPLAAIKGFSDLLREGHRDLDAERIDGYLDVIREQTSHLIRLTDDLLLLARESRTDLPMVLEPVAVVPFVEKVAASMPGAGRVKVVIDAEGTPAEIETDPFRLERALTNLLENALKYSGEDTGVVMTVGGGDPAGDGTLRIRVTDEGRGIDAEDLDRIFDLFYRTRDAAKAAEGSGLGLAITRALTHALGGTITAESTPGQGATFTLDLPTNGPALGGPRHAQLQGPERA